MPERQVSEPLAMGSVPVRQVVLVRVKAQPLLAPGKAYSAMLDYLDEHHMKLNLPTVELYQDGVLTLEATQ